MNMWDTYESRIRTSGATQRDAILRRETHWLNTRLKDSLSYHQVLLDGVSRKVAIINSDNLNEKLMYSMPGEDIRNGSLVEWMGNHWTVVEKDANNEIYTKVKLLQCNYLLKWIVVEDGEPIIKEQWCTIDDGTKYMTGQYNDRQFIVVNGDTRVAMTITRNNDTARFNRQSRFLIGDPGAATKQAFKLTKPLSVGNTYNGDGVLKFVLSEANTTDYDDFNLMIPDYFKYFPDEDGYRKTVLEDTPDYVKVERGVYI